MNYLAFLWLMLAVSCAGSGIENYDDIVTERGAQDFDCEEEYVKTIQLSLDEYIVRGCGREQRYEIDCTSLSDCETKNIIPIR